MQGAVTDLSHTVRPELDRATAQQLDPLAPLQIPGGDTHLWEDCCTPATAAELRVGRFQSNSLIVDSRLNGSHAYTRTRDPSSMAVA